MKATILILHMVSGSILEISDQSDVTALKNHLTDPRCIMRKKVWSSWVNPSGGGEYCCTIKGCVTHINMGNVEYIEEQEKEMTELSSLKPEFLDIIPFLE